jgi:hypothetical protein
MDLPDIIEQSKQSEQRAVDEKTVNEKAIDEKAIDEEFDVVMFTSLLMIVQLMSMMDYQGRKSLRMP